MRRGPTGHDGDAAQRGRGRKRRQAVGAGGTRSGAHWSADWTPWRALAQTSPRAGRVLDVPSFMEDGRVTLSGTYDDSGPDHSLSGKRELVGFRVRNAPVVAQLLQAMTFYGLVQMVQGPGLAFDRLIVPFRLNGDTLELTDARAFSSSLGMTAKGTLDMAHKRADLQGTIVPAYFFNTLLGGIPLVGRLCSRRRMRSAAVSMSTAYP
jgi:hypothetical protein